MSKRYKKIYNISTIKNKELKEIVEKRYNILIILIIAIICVLIGNLFVIQVIKNDYFVNKVEQLSQNLVYSNSTPRGRIYDRNGNIIVDNEAVKVIYYKKVTGVTTEEEINMAYKMAELIDLDYTKLSDKNIRRFWIKLNSDKAKEKITDEEWQ